MDLRDNDELNLLSVEKPTVYYNVGFLLCDVLLSVDLDVLQRCIYRYSVLSLQFVYCPVLVFLQMVYFYKTKEPVGNGLILL